MWFANIFNKICRLNCTLKQCSVFFWKAPYLLPTKAGNRSMDHGLMGQINHIFRMGQ